MKLNQKIDSIIKRCVQEERVQLNTDVIGLIKSMAPDVICTVVVTGSPESWVRTFCKHLGFELILVIGTQLESVGNIYTGNFAGAECFGAEKRRRVWNLLNEFAQKGQYPSHIISIGNLPDDVDMMRIADESYVVGKRNKMVTRCLAYIGS